MLRIGGLTIDEDIWAVRILFFQEESGRYVLHIALNHTFFTKITDQDLLSVYIVVLMLKNPGQKVEVCGLDDFGSQARSPKIV